MLIIFKQLIRKVVFKKKIAVIQLYFYTRYSHMGIGKLFELQIGLS